MNTLIRATYITILLFISAPVFANKAEICKKITQINKGQSVAEAFYLLGPPTNFNSPKSFDVYALDKEPTPPPPLPKNATEKDKKKAELHRIENDPLMGPFLRSSKKEQNSLSWTFGGSKDYHYGIKTKGATITEIFTNVECF